MNTVIIKEDGREQLFDAKKLESGLMKAAVEAEAGIDAVSDIVDEVVDLLESNGIDKIKSKELSSLVKTTILREGEVKLAERFITFSAEKQRTREMNSELMQEYEEITFSSEADSEIKRENANISSVTAMGTMLKYGSEGAKKFSLLYLLSQRVAEAHKEGWIHIHDLDFLSTGTETCCHIPIDKLFSNGGFNTGHGAVREPGNIRTAASLAAICIQANQNDQHGGQAIPLFDWYLAPYVALTYVKTLAKYIKIRFDIRKEDYLDLRKTLIDYRNSCNRKLVMNDESYKEMKELIINFLDTVFNRKYEDHYDLTEGQLREVDKIFDDVYEDVDDEVYQAMEGFIHNMNTLHSRAGSQVPFSSINFGTDISTEGRMIVRNELLATKAGMGNGETAIFPISIFKEKAGVNYNPEDPNYDLWKLSCEVSALRLYPNFVNLDAPYNAKLYVEGHPETEMATMGCVEESETVDYMINDNLYIESFKKAFERLSRLGEIKTQGNSEYIDLESLDVKVRDTLAGKDVYTKVKKVIKNSNVTDMRTIRFTNGRCLTATSDHPLPVIGKGRTFVKDIVAGDKIPVADTKEEVEIKEITDKLGRGKNGTESYDFETYSDTFDVSGLCSHNCRTRVGDNIAHPENTVIPGRGNLSFTSINLPRLAIESQGNKKKFFKLLDKYMDLVHDELLERFEIQCSKHPINFPFLMGQGTWVDSDKLGPNDDMRDVLKNGTLAVGFIGLAETLIYLTGKHHGESEKSQELGLKIVKHMRDMTDKWSIEEKMNYGLLATPAEGLSGRFVRMDKKRYGTIKGVTDKEYYTNSFHVPVYYNISAYKKIDIEAPYHNLCNGGHITYIELDGNPTDNIEAFEKVVRYMHDKGVGYGAINHPLDRDSVCGYVGVIPEGGVCPRCGRKEFEPMTIEMWNKLKRYAGAGNVSTCGACGNPDEEADRVTNKA